MNRRSQECEEVGGSVARSRDEMLKVRRTRRSQSLREFQTGGTMPRKVGELIPSKVGVCGKGLGWCQDSVALTCSFPYVAQQ